ncbi:MAG: alpha-glucosidase [Herpetosiphonaceae bacterium]|nr:MAG: alpha-glucosidase [Herpetosiphonaceae bacterium]
MSDQHPTRLGAVRSWRREGRSLILECGGPSVAITILSPQIVRVRLAPEGTFAPRRSWAVTPPDETFPETPFEVREIDGELVVETGRFSVYIQRDPCRISFADHQGQRFCADSEGMGWTKAPDKQGGVSCAKRIESGEHFYGFGERTGLLDKRSRRVINWATDPATEHGPGTDPLYMAIPVFLALRHGLAYGIFLNNTWRSAFDMGQTRPGTWLMEAAGGELDYYVLFGPTPAEVCKQIGQLLGTMPLPPIWALGYHQSRWSYGSSEIVRELVAEFRGRDIPCDVIHLDIDYMDGYRVFTWNSEHFPEPERLIDDLRKQGFKVVTIIDPGVKIDPKYHVYKEGMERGMFVRMPDGEVFCGYCWPDAAVFPDYMRPEVREWWGDLQKTLIDAGVSGIWNDMNEPAVFSKPFSEGGGEVGTINLEAIQGPEGEKTTHAEVHNLYGYTMARASYEGLCRHLGNQRPFVLTRSGFAGFQRWSAGWMGDNSSWWEHLEMAMPQLINMGLSGVPFVGVDIGGFTGNATAELFARWMEYGAFMPFCRGHSAIHTERHEPWVFGERVESICRRYLRLRYRMLPYLYSLFWEATQRGSPLLRPLFYHFPDDPATYELHDQVMLGPFLMIAPIYHPGREHRHVYLPEGQWYDWWDDSLIDGPAHLLAYAPLEKIPLFVRAGAIIPSWPDMNYTGERPVDRLTLDLYPGNGSFTLYEDDGHTFNYLQGEYATVHYQLRRESEQLTVEIGGRQGRYTPAARKLQLRVHGVGPDAARDHEDASFDEEQRCVVITLDDDGKARTLTFRLG